MTSDFDSPHVVQSLLTYTPPPPHPTPKSKLPRGEENLGKNDLSSFTQKKLSGVILSDLKSFFGRKKSRKFYNTSNFDQSTERE